MEREPNVFTDEGTQEAFLQRAIHSKLNRPSSLPVFHISPRPNLPSPFQAPYHHEGKFQNYMFKHQNRQSEFMTGDPLLVNQPHIIHNAPHENSPKFTSPSLLENYEMTQALLFSTHHLQNQKRFHTKAMSLIILHSL